MRFGLSALAALPFLACSPSKTPERTTTPTAHALVQQLRSLGAFEALRGAGPREPRGLSVTLPRDGAAALRVEAATGVWIAVGPEHPSMTKGTLEGEAIVLEKAELDTDVVYASSSSQAEEIRVLKSDRASPVARYRLRVGPAVASVRLHDGRVQVFDREGMVRIESTPFFAVDARGVRRDGRVRLETIDETTFALETEIDRDGLEYPIAVDPAWTSGGVMGAGHTHFLQLTSGKILGCGGGTSAELYDPATNSFTFTGSTAKARGDAMAAPLGDGRAIIGGPDQTTEIWNPTTGTWSAGPDLSEGRKFGGAVGLADGRALFCAGFYTGATEVFDPATNLMKFLPPIAVHSGPAVVRLADGRAMVAGGVDNAGYPTPGVEIFDPKTDTWSGMTAMKKARTSFSLGLLSTGEVMAVGSASTGAEVWNPTTKLWRYIAPQPRLRGLPAMITLPSGNLLVAGGESSGIGDIYDPIADKWTSVSGGTPRGAAQAFLLASNKAVIVGGAGNAELFEILSLGGSCTQANECSSGFCVDGTCCDSACTGTCSACDLGGGKCTLLTGAPHGARTCAPYAACKAGACETACTVNADCTSTNYCAAGACVPKRKNGLACAAAGDCESNVCVDGVCCNAACAGQCEACDVPGSFGTCSPVNGPPRNGRTLCVGVGAGTTCGITCDGADRSKCNYPGATTGCGSKGCKDGIERRTSACDGAGLCKDTAKSCGAYACGSDACKVTCTASSDCSSGFYCKSGACVKVEDLGVVCATGATCTTGNCVDGVCCATSSCESGSSCSVGPVKGLCSKTLGVLCAVDEECGSGHCVDGVCCDSACAGQCEACDVAGSTGTCQPVAGVPHGGRTRCSEGLDECKALSCDGTARDKCGAFAKGPTTSCGRVTCAASTFTGKGSCDGKGECTAATSTSCVPFACDLKGCLTSCATDGDCAAGFQCAGKTCEPRSAACSNDQLASIDKLGVSTPCAPYRCGADGACQKSCEASGECQGGAVCDGATKTCVAAATVIVEDGGGCTTSRGSARAPFGLMFFFATVWLARRRGAMSALLASLSLLVGCKVDPAPGPALGTQKGAVTAWRSLARLNYNRVDHTATTLPDGRVLVIGGSVNNYGYYANIEIWDPKTNKWKVEAMPGSRTSHAALLLPTGKVLVAGGVGDLGPYPFEYDPATNTWDSTGQVVYSGNGARLYPLPAGDALLYSTSNGLAIYRATSKLFEGAPPMITPRYAPGIQPLPDGRLYFYGGDIGGGVTASTAELYDPTDNKFKPAAAPPLVGPTFKLPSGKLLMGWTTSAIYDGATNTWTAAAPMPTPRGGHSFPLPNGRTVIFGWNDPTVDLYDEATNTWTRAETQPRKSYRDAAAQLSDGSIVYAGGMEIPAFISTDEVDMLKLVETGGTCSMGGDCFSKNCVAGICCDKPCGGTCEACDVTGKVGTCTALSGKPHYARSCGAEFACITGSCATTCTDDTSCLSTGYCSGGNCATKAAKGGSCTANNQCATGFCADGHCCDGACTGQCEACDVAGKLGECTPVLGKPHGARTACTGTGLGTTCGPVCDGKDPKKCTYAATSALCSADACTDGIETHASLCDGAGTCKDTAKSCGAYACGGDSCRLSCTGDSECTAGYYCKAGACVVIEDLGTACTAGTSCKTGFCVGGVCCGSASCSAGSSCATPSKKGFCKKLAGVACTLSDECGSGICVDGVCCESSCDGQCEACDVFGAKGKCTPVAGAPHGTRPACDDGGGDACKPRQCEGTKDTKSCVGFKADGKTVCAAAMCTGGDLTAPSTCDGSGTCVAPKSTSCAPYACSGDACRTSCTVDEHCSTGFECRGGACISRGNKCSDDGLESIDKDGKHTSCAPFRCGSTGECLKECATSNDCAQFTCDLPTKMCVAPATVVQSEDSGGCSYGAQPRAQWGFLLALTALWCTTKRRGGSGRATRCLRSQ